MLRLQSRDFRQLSMVDMLLPDELAELPEDLAKMDAWLDDDRFFEPFRDRYDTLMGRPSVAAETYLRIMALKQQYSLSDRQVCEMVKDRISWRRFCRVPWSGSVPHPSSLSKIRKRLDANGGDHMAELNRRLVQSACERGLVKARKLRVDTTVVEANMHYPTDASLMADGVRVITRLVKRVEALGVSCGTGFRDRGRSVKRRLLGISKVLRRRTGEAWKQVRRITAQIADLAEKTTRAADMVLTTARGSCVKKVRYLARKIEEVKSRTEQVIRQARQVNAGNLHLEHRLVSIFEPDARAIRKGKAHRHTEFGYKVRLSETEDRVITEYSVFKGNPGDEGMLIEAVERHSMCVGRKPWGVATDRGFSSRRNEQSIQQMGVIRVSVPCRGKRSESRTQHERQRWFRRLQRWRAGQEATISVLKRRYGMARSLYLGKAGCQRWVGGAIWGYNLWRIAQLT